MGPWSRQAETWLNTYIPVDPLKGEILRMQPGWRSRWSTIFSGGGASVYSKADGLAWCGTTEDWRGFDRESTGRDSRADSRRESRRILPAITSTPTLVMHTACLRPVTPDWLPNSRPGVLAYRNAWLATGAGKKGILLAPGIGKSVADLITEDETEPAHRQLLSRPLRRLAPRPV